MAEEEPEFGFKVKFHKNTYGGVNSGWEVSLPHQCDRWEITGGRWYPASQEEAVAKLELFIKEAQEALAALNEGKQHNLDRFDDDEDEDEE